MAVALKQPMTPEFVEYQKQVLDHAKVMETVFRNRGVKMVSDGTDTHLLLLDLRGRGTDDARVERVLQEFGIAVNKVETR